MGLASTPSEEFHSGGSVSQLCEFSMLKAHESVTLPESMESSVLEFSSSLPRFICKQIVLLPRKGGIKQWSLDVLVIY